jgi:uncharacterized lipoprotein
VKNLFYLVIAVLLMGGCTYKNEAMNLPSYKADYAGAVATDKKSVFVSVIKDMRKDKRSVGYVLDDGEKIARLYSDVNFPAKYKEGLGYALNIAGFNTDVTAENASLIMEVYIRNIEIVYNKKSFDKNLTGEIEIEVLIRRGGGEVVTQNFRQKGGKWIVKSYESKDLEPFLYSLFSDSVNDIVSRLTRY